MTKRQGMGGRKGWEGGREGGREGCKVPFSEWRRASFSEEWNIHKMMYVGLVRLLDYMPLLCIKGMT